MPSRDFECQSCRVEWILCSTVSSLDQKWPCRISPAHAIAMRRLGQPRVRARHNGSSRERTEKVVAAARERRQNTNDRGQEWRGVSVFSVLSAFVTSVQLQLVGIPQTHHPRSLRAKSVRRPHHRLRRRASDGKTQTTGARNGAGFLCFQS